MAKKKNILTNKLLEITCKLYGFSQTNQLQPYLKQNVYKILKKH